VSDFDQMGIVVDWLDACRRGDLEALLDLYASDASLECKCNGVQLCRGRGELEAYWRPRLDAFSPAAFGLEEIRPLADGVVLDYSSADDALIRMFFGFSPEGKIVQSLCEPSTPERPRCPAC
jgi:ketosteroid isomerase-like protein